MKKEAAKKVKAKAKAEAEAAKTAAVEAKAAAEAASTSAGANGEASPRLHLHLHKKFGRANVDKKGYRFCRLDQDTEEGAAVNSVLEATLLRVHASVHLVDAEGEGRVGGGEERSGEA